MTSKSACAVLQELMIKNGQIPSYDFLPALDGKGFTCRVSGLSFSCLGTGLSKKDAKQNGARALLEQFANVGLYFPKAEDPDLSNVSPIKKETMESVAKIKDLCATYNLPIPQYDLINDSGLPHCKMFTVECKFGGLTFSANSTTKKIARQLAATKLLDYMNVNMSSFVKEFEEMTNIDATEIAKQRYMELQESAWKPNLGLIISNFPKALHQEKGEDPIQEAIEMIKNPPIPDPIECVLNVMKVLDLLSEWEFHFSGDKKVICFLNITQTTPSLTYYSSLQTCENQAKLSAAESALKSLLVLLE